MKDNIDSIESLEIWKLNQIYIFMLQLGLDMVELRMSSVYLCDTLYMRCSLDTNNYLLFDSGQINTLLKTSKNDFRCPGIDFCFVHNLGPLVGGKFPFDVLFLDSKGPF